jgi:hypothetical protein
MAGNLLNRGMIQFIRLNYGKLSLTVDNKQLHGCPEEISQKHKERKKKTLALLLQAICPFLSSTHN